MTGIVSSSYYEKINENSRFFACSEVFVSEQMICEPQSIKPCTSWGALLVFRLGKRNKIICL